MLVNISSTIQKQPLEVFCKKGVLRNFVKFTVKHLCQSLFLNKIAGFRSATLLKKRLWHRCFSVHFTKFLRSPFLQNTSGRLLLTIAIYNNFIKTGFHFDIAKNYKSLMYTICKL